MLKQPQHKYRPGFTMDMPTRQWPSNTITKPPVWLSTDLRDGNQAIFEPMNVATKLRFFNALVQIGFKEIEVGFPAASQIDFDVIRHLIDTNSIPSDVTPMVMTQAREDLIERTVESVKGAKRAIIHIYNATAPVWRNTVFRMTIEEVIALVRSRVEFTKRLTDAQPETEWVLQYSPECFNMTEPEVALQACNTAIQAWNAGPNRPIIINLPTTVESTTPNVFADQIEWMNQRLERREHVVLSVHPHNDRGTGVATAELAMLAGAQRVEGCLLGNGERCGNVDLVTLTLNLYTQGINPGLDFSDINAVARLVEECTRIPTHPRHPYVGDLVYTAFSGSHQDAIKKGFDIRSANSEDSAWEVPYLPIDPADLGRSYDSVIRVNSQSGKGGIAYLMERDHSINMPRRLQIEFSAIVQRASESTDAEVSTQALWQLFDEHFIARSGKPFDNAVALISHHTQALPQQQVGITLTLSILGKTHTLQGQGNGPLDAAVDALNKHVRVPIRLLHFEEKSIGQGADTQAFALVEIAQSGRAGSRHGAGANSNIVTAGVLAVLAACQRTGCFTEMVQGIAA